MDIFKANWKQNDDFATQVSSVTTKFWDSWIFYISSTMRKKIILKCRIKLSWERTDYAETKGHRYDQPMAFKYGCKEDQIFLWQLCLTANVMRIQIWSICCYAKKCIPWFKNYFTFTRQVLQINKTLQIIKTSSLSQTKFLSSLNNSIT